MRNFRSSFIEGTRNIKTSSFKDHAATDMHGHAITLLKKQLSSTPTEYAPIAKAMASSTMDKATTECLKRKFDVAYTIAKESLAFTKMKPLCELEEHHVAQLGQGYKNDRACSMFIEYMYIACDQQERLVATLSKAHFLVSKLTLVLMLETPTMSSFLSFTLTPIQAMVLYMFGTGSFV